MDYSLNVALEESSVPESEWYERVLRLRNRWNADLKAWTTNNLFTPDQIMYRLTQRAHSRLFYSHQLETFQATYKQLWEIKKPVLASALTELFRSMLPSAIDTAPLLADLLCYLAKFPFSEPSTEEIGFDGFMRGICALEDQQNLVGHGARVGPWVGTRGRSRRDYRRVVFQGLADPVTVSTSQELRESNDASIEEDIQEEILHNAGQYNSFLIDVSDESPDTTDILDTLTVAQPDYAEPGMIHVPRAAFGPIVNTLPRLRVQLDKLSLPAPKLFHILKLLLVINIGGRSQAAELYNQHRHEFERVAHCLMGAFVTKGGANISWKDFNRAIRRTMPNLMLSLSDLFQYLTKPYAASLEEMEASFPVSGEILTLPVLSQLGLFMPTSLNFAQLTQRFTTDDTHDINDLIQSLVSWEAPFVLLVTGLDVVENGQVENPRTIGMFLPHISSATQYKDGGSQDNFIFQLSPVHEVFRADNREVQDAKFNAEGFVSSACQGVRLMLDKRLEYSTLMHGGKEHQLRSDVERGSHWERKIKVKNMEAWGFDGEWIRDDKPFPPFGDLET